MDETSELLGDVASRLARFVLDYYPMRGCWILLRTDQKLDVREIVRLYGLRFKIELGFKQESEVVGGY